MAKGPQALPCTSVYEHSAGDNGSQSGRSFGDDSESLAIRETKQLRRFRFFFTIFLTLVSVGLALTIYFITANAEEENFVAQFEDRSDKIIDAVHYRIERNVGAFEAFSFGMTSYVMHKNLTWPFVVIPDFQIKGAAARTMAKSVSIIIYPFVTDEKRSDWEVFAADNLGWIDQGLEFEEKFDHYYETHRELQGGEKENNGSSDLVVATNITQTTANGDLITAPQGGGPFFPAWQSSPVASELVNFDLHSTELFSDSIDLLWDTENAIVGDSEDGTTRDSNLKAYKASWEGHHSYDLQGPVAKLYFPIFDALEPNERSPVAVMTSVLYWESFFWNVLPPNQDHVDVVLESACGDKSWTFSIHDGHVDYLGIGDLHDKKYDSMVIHDVIFRFSGLDEAVAKYKGVPVTDQCSYQLHLYPTTQLEDQYRGPTAWILFGLVVAIFALAIGLIFFYDRRVEKNYRTLYSKAKQAGAIVSSMFPAAVRKRMYNDEAKSEADSQSNTKNVGTGAFKQMVPTAVDAQKIKLKGFLNQPGAEDFGGDIAMSGRVDDVEGQQKGNQQRSDKAIADLFPDVTILFADIVGFTPWSSQREPAEIFTLLQTLYFEFDSTARSMKVFKVETIGDCYVAATGLPEPQADHALRMARFAVKCMVSIAEVTKRLEIQLGPDTGELRMRIGLHSGPVTAGVLKGAKARFQLFGDTMNMAARMEHNSQANRIQCSEATADLLREAGKEHWITPRKDKVAAKGKGLVQTYWLVHLSGGPSIDASDREDDLSETNVCLDHNPNDQLTAEKMGKTDFLAELAIPGNRYQRLIDWNVELLAGLLKQIEAKRRDSKAKTKLASRSKTATPHMELEGGKSAIDEVTEVIELPQFQETAQKKKKVTPARDVALGADVMIQLRDYVTTIASMYHDNPFHNFEHASHVTMSTNKLLKRVVVKNTDEVHSLNAVDLHDYTYGITSDPLTQFALVFCALIHDVDHAGVSNYQLIQEHGILAKLYQNKSVAEQNSVDLAWDLLMDPNYDDLRKAIYADDEDLRRFRQLVVNVVLATDIFDADMKAIREKRWGKAFQYGEDEGEEMDEATLPVKALQRDYDSPLANIQGANLKATIVMEHLIQASDVAHTMQHWEIYLKWNERLFNEMYSAFKNGRAAKDPSLSWYEGEIMFFDKYIIPLAKKLDDCGVFGVSSDECLNYAKQNRKKWAIEGDKIVDVFIAKYNEKFGDAASSGSKRSVASASETSSGC